MKAITYNKGDIIFRQGDAADTMYSVVWGRVGIYLDYGTDKEKKLAELDEERFFGEMGLIDHAPRSATAVALEKGTQIMEITEDRIGELFSESPAKVLMIMQQLTGDLRRLTKEYMRVCALASKMTKAEESAPEEKSVRELIEEAEARTDSRELFRARDHYEYF